MIETSSSELPQVEQSDDRVVFQITPKPDMGNAWMNQTLKLLCTISPPGADIIRQVGDGFFFIITTAGNITNSCRSKIFALLEQGIAIHVEERNLSNESRKKSQAREQELANGASPYAWEIPAGPTPSYVARRDVDPHDF